MYSTQEELKQSQTRVTTLTAEKEAAINENHRLEEELQKLKMKQLLTETLIKKSNA
ncbi:hypothetical protein AAAC51_06350 [Priestia megaterium]